MASKHPGLHAKRRVMITELGIEKNKDFKLKDEDIRKVKEAARRTCINAAVPPICCWNGIIRNEDQDNDIFGFMLVFIIDMRTLRLAC